MFAALLLILKTFLGFGLAGILIIIGMIALVTWVVKTIIARIYYATRNLKKKDKKGGDNK